MLKKWEPNAYKRRYKGSKRGVVVLTSYCNLK